MSKTLGTGTYSPDDNKLRFYPDSRLSSEDYNRAKAAGFKWAPKQELFVAPAWSPEREDLLLEWCGEVGDEDKSLVDRAEERADRFGDYSDSRRDDAESAHKAVSAIADGIPLGQPILVGHHSERHARRDAERIENGMRRAVKMWETAEYWKRRASGAIHAAKYKERPDVRARRIKTIEADKRRREKCKAEAEHLIRFWEGKLFLKNQTTGERRPIEITQENSALLCDLLGKMPHCGVAVLGLDGEGYFSAWDVLRPAEDRYKNCPTKTVPELQEIALRLQAKIVANCDRWIAHYSRRLEYERAMLAEDGGTAADKTGPEVGGAVKCWASPGYGKGWAYIQKVNKVSITLHDQADFARADGIKRIFRRIMPLDKLSAVMTKSEVEAAKAAGMAVETHGGTGFYLREAGDNTPAPTRDQERNTAHVEAVAARASSPEAPKAADFDAMRQSLKAGVQVVSVPNLFPTPPDIARQMVEAAFADGWGVQVCAEMNDRCRIFEPSAGTGNILAAIVTASKGPFACRADVVTVEENQTLSNKLSARFMAGMKHVCADFLSLNGELGKFDRIIMNPPFDHGADIRHILHARKMLAPGGRLVALCANGPKQQAELMPLSDSWIDLPAGSFKEQGTGVNVAMLTMNAD